MERFDTFVGLISQIHKSIQRIKSIEMTELGLRANHTMCLHYLRRHREGLTAAELSALCEEDKAAISRTLSELIELGYVSCEAPEDRKKYRAKLFLTEKGEELACYISERAESIVEEVGDFLSADQREVLYTTLACISARLQRLQTGDE
jgi:DNA-binding MarR family transcriptional regulator